MRGQRLHPSGALPFVLFERWVVSADQARVYFAKSWVRLVMRTSSRIRGVMLANSSMQ